MPFIECFDDVVVKYLRHLELDCQQFECRLLTILAFCLSSVVLTEILPVIQEAGLECPCYR